MRRVVLYSSGHRDQMTTIEPIPTSNVKVDKPVHFVIQRDGFLDKPLPPSNKTQDFVIVLIGNRFFTAEQMDTLFSLYLKLGNKWGIEAEDWVPSDEVGPYALGLDIETLRERLATL